MLSVLVNEVGASISYQQKQTGDLIAQPERNHILCCFQTNGVNDSYRVVRVMWKMFAIETGRLLIIC